MFETNLADFYETKRSRFVIEQKSKKTISQRQKTNKQPKKIIFLDRDGPCLIEPKTDGQIDSLSRLEFTPGVIVYLNQILKNLDFLIVMVSNQNGVGSKFFPEELFMGPHRFMLETFAGQEVILDKIFVDLSFPEEKQPSRKPGIAMLTDYLNQSLYDLKNSFVIGDRQTDMQLAKNLGCKGIWFQEKTKEKKQDHQLPVVLTSNLWQEIYEFLKSFSF